MSDVRRVLVVGGGVGGLSTAIALRRLGIEVDVVEVNPNWDVYGVGIIQPGNALRALGMLGVVGECIAAGYPMEGVRSHDRDGNVLTDIDFEPPPGVTGPMMNGLPRPELHRILSERTLASGADVRTGVTIADLTQSADGVDVTFTDDTTGTYDLVVGADGINSLVRRLVFGAEPKPEYTGQLCWRYNLPRYPGLERLWMFNGSFGRSGFVPLGEDLMYVLLIEKPPEGSPLRPPEDELADLMRERLAEYGGPIAEVRDQITDPSKVVVRPVEAILVPPPWHRGRVLLIGDAAHATSPHVGQGAAQAIEDAVVLAEELAADQPLDAALERFMDRRFERCKIVVEGSRQIGTWEKDGDTDNPDYPLTVARITNAVAAPL
jgi:2-polyprenyl-6-methoxyphenol hydroxylase-like FAD-dependent oxidoreductase